MRLPWAPEFYPKDVVILNEETVFSGRCQIKQFQFQYPLFGGGISGPVSRELICRPPAVAVLLYDAEKDSVVLIEQFRTGGLQEKDSPWLLEIVAGVTEPDENIEETARREVIEETGCTALAMMPICAYLVSPGISNEKIYIYCGQVNAPDKGGNHGLVDEGEDIKVCVLKTTDAFQLLSAGKIVSSPTVIALQWLQINQASLRFPSEIE